MILAVTCNPTIDRSLWVPCLVEGRVHRALRVHCAAGGKGMNVVRAAVLLGAETIACAPLAGHTGRLFAELAQSENLPGDWYWRASGETRNCLLIHHETGDSTVVNEPGCEMPNQDWEGFARHVANLAEGANAVVFSGSLPPGPTPRRLADLAGRLAGRARLVCVDTSGPALREVVRRPAGLQIKVNATELAEASGQAPAKADETTLASLAQGLLDRGASCVIVTMGASGALVWSSGAGWKASAPQVSIVSSVGSGDAFTAAWAAARLAGLDVPSALAEAVACGAANATTPLPARFPPELARALRSEVQVRRI